MILNVRFQTDDWMNIILSAEMKKRRCSKHDIVVCQGNTAVSVFLCLLYQLLYCDGAFQKCITASYI